MTIKEFSEKYGISYTLVCEVAVKLGEGPYDEEELYNAVLNCIAKKEIKAHVNYMKYDLMYERLNEKHKQL